MTKAARAPLWIFAVAFALVSAGVAALLWRDGHVEHANAEVAAVLAPAALSAIFALLASRTFDDVMRRVVDAVKAWRGTAP